jgi:nucleotidyltransferase/DNA polymerase involved in DNA repair
MRVACVAIPSFAVAVERRTRPELASQPVIVHDRRAVFDAAAPDAAGVRAGLSLRQAQALCPHAVFLPANLPLYQEIFAAMLDALERVTPIVEPAELGTAYAGVSGLESHYRDEFALAGALVEAVREATALLPCAGLADQKFTALVAARATPPGDAGLVAPGREHEFLSDRETALLPVGPDVLRRLDLLALRTLGDVAALPRTALEAQFGGAGRRLWELAAGADSEPLRPRQHEELLSERMSFDAPVVQTEALVAAGHQLILRLVRRLRGRTARRMHIQLLSDERIVWERIETFREPVGDERPVLLILKTRLSLLALPQAVDTIAVTLSGIGREMAKQAKLFTDSHQNLNQIGEAIRQLRARYNRPVVYRVMEVDPWSRHPEERSVLVPYDA